MSLNKRLINTAGGGIPPFSAGVDGQYMAVSDTSGNIYISNDFGSNFFLTANIPSNTYKMYISHTGQYVYAAKTGFDGYVYFSNDFGVTFNLLFASDVFVFSASWNGEYCAYRSQSNGKLKVYSNYGQTYVGESGGTIEQFYISLNFDGQYIYSFLTDGGNNRIYYNNNYGVGSYSIGQIIFERTGILLETSATGQFTYANNNLTGWIAQDDNSGGGAWAIKQSAFQSQSMSVDASGSRIVVVKNSDSSFYLSTNGATTMTLRPIGGVASNAVISGNGTYLGVIKDGNTVAVATDGSNFTKFTSVAANLRGLSMARYN